MISRAEGVVIAQIGDQAVALNTRMEYVALDGMGEVVWQLLETPQSIDSLVASITERYDVDDATCRRDLTTFVDQLATHGLVTQSPASP